MAQQCGAVLDACSKNRKGAVLRLRMVAQPPFQPSSNPATLELPRAFELMSACLLSHAANRCNCGK
jgi:hypothetical protein